MSEVESGPVPDEAQPATGVAAEADSVPEQPAEPEPDWRDAVADPDLRKQLDRYNTIDDLTRHNLALRRR